MDLFIQFKVKNREIGFGIYDSRPFFTSFKEPPDTTEEHTTSVREFTQQIRDKFNLSEDDFVEIGIAFDDAMRLAQHIQEKQNRNSPMLRLSEVKKYAVNLIKTNFKL